MPARLKNLALVLSFPIVKKHRDLSSTSTDQPIKELPDLDCEVVSDYGVPRLRPPGAVPGSVAS
ncbi:hypothetical protein H8D57_03230 [bacterium]|nr:hypothetical protein [bacterium]